MNDRDRDMLARLERETLYYFEHSTSPHTGLVADKSQPGSPASITATGMGLSVLCVSAERGWLTRAEAARRALVTLRFLAASPQGPEPDATGYRGFYYHFLHMTTGRRAWHCELSTIDTAFLIAGVLAVGAYFEDVPELGELADMLARRVDWKWACNGTAMVGHGWTPEHGHLSSGWTEGYSEALLLYVLALGSPTHPIDVAGYDAWTTTFETKTFYGIEYLYAGPLFIHQFSQLWLDLRELRDARCRAIGHDYFENSRRATLVHRQYAIENPHGFEMYSKVTWGLTASDGPGPATRVIDGVRREFFGYIARGAPLGPDDGTISPWGVVASLPFAPDEVCETLHHAIERLDSHGPHAGGFDASINATFQRDGKPWASPWRFGLNEGPIVMMIENTTSELVWTIMRRSSHIVAGLRRAGFSGGWLAR
jgi:hypothetical protein